MKRFAIAASLALVATPAMGQNIEQTNGYAYLMRQEYPVIQGDVTDRPYRIVGHVTKQIRKFLTVSKAPDFEKVQKELWERARKNPDVDAVIKVTWGDSQAPTWTASASEARGVMIKFLTDSEIAEWKAKQAPAVAPAAPPAAPPIP